MDVFSDVKGHSHSIVSKSLMHLINSKMHMSSVQICKDPNSIMQIIFLQTLVCPNHTSQTSALDFIQLTHW